MQKTYKLVVAEKKSVATSISTVLGANKREGGFFIGNGYIISYCAGHLLELAPPDAYDKRYAKWRFADLPIIPDKWKHVPIKGKEAQLKILQGLMSRPDVECVINACDAGREGENIFRHVYHYVGCTKQVYRLWIASLEDAAIRAGFDNLKDGAEYDNLYAAAYCRERADWLVGLNCTRLFSILYGATLNTGRVQSPTLAMLVEREADIDRFIKEPLYTPTIDCGSFTASGERTKDKRAAEEIHAACGDSAAVVRSVERQTKTSAPPKLYDLTTLQREANRLFGFTAQQTLDYAQALYEKAILSYPRVDSRYLTSDMRDTVGALVEWAQGIMSLQCGADFVPDVDRLVDDSRVTDHHAIIPTAKIISADIPTLPFGERTILNLVAARLLSAVAPAHSYEIVTAVLECGEYSFTARGKTVISDGWKAIDKALRTSLKSESEAEDSEIESALPELAEGQTFNGVTAIIREGSTTPPKHFTEDTTLAGMETAGIEDMPEDVERKGLGTPATRAAVLEKIIKSGFVERQKKNLIPTEKGKNLIAVLPDALTSPTLTAGWEDMLKQVERGEMTAEAFMYIIKAFTGSIVEVNNTPKPEFFALFGNDRSEAEPLGNCPRCGASVREGAKGFFCDTRTCGFKIWKASKFWTAKKKPLTAAIVTALLKDGKVEIKGLYSEKKDRKYDATVALNDTGDGYVNFKLDFGSRRVKR
ncbi:MAG: DNA topoisomerase [Oscillospiraceae bacterium]|nr:DNA topoisomerase [Oscillospiraceae bacterium]